MDISKTIAQRIVKLRRELKLSQEKLAELSGLHRNYIGLVERAERKITVNSLNKIAKALNISLCEILKDF